MDRLKVRRLGGAGRADDPSIEPYLMAFSRGAAGSFIGVVAAAVFGLALVIVVTRGFTRAEVGVFFETVALFTLATTVAVWGADTGVVRTIPRLVVLGRVRDARPVIRIAAIAVLAVALVLAFALAIFARPLSDLLTSGVSLRDMETQLRASAPFLPVAAVYAVVLAATRGLGRMGPTNLVDRVGRTAAQPVFALGVASMGMGAAALIVSWALPYAISCVVAGVWLLSILRSSTADGNVEPATDRRVLFREFWRFAAPRGLAGVFAVAVLWLDTLLLGALRSTEEAGVYAAATRFLVFGGFTSQAVIQAIAPTMSELITRRNLAAAASVYRTGTAWSIALGWPVYLTLAVFAPAILASFGAGYREAATALAIVAVAMLVGSGVGAIDVVLLMAGKSSWNLLNAAAAVAVNVALNLVLIPRMGMTGAAIAWAASIVTNNVAPLIQVRAHLGIDPLSRGTVSMAVAACVAFGVVGLLLRAAFGLHVGVLVAAVLAGLVIYVPLIWRLRRVLGLDLLVRSARRRGSMA